MFNRNAPRAVVVDRPSPTHQHPPEPDPHNMPRPRRRFRFLPRFHVIRDAFALIGLGFVLVELVRYVIIPILILMNGTN